MAFRYKVESVARKDDILLLTLTPKQLSRALRFEPGQYATIGFIRDGRPTPMRCFSIISTPANGVLQFAMRIRGNFTQSAAELKPGDTVRVQGPFGDFTINSDYDRHVVMLAGGIGITPFLSIMRDASERNSKLPMTLLYSNSRSTQVPFLSQLQSLERQNPHLQMQFFSSDTTGQITGEYIRQITAAHDNTATYFICGPKSFARTMKAGLQSAGIHESRIISESFAQGNPVSVGDSKISISSLTYGLTAAALIITTGGVMLLDLQQNLPKLATAHAAAATQSTSTSTSNDQPTTAENTDDSSTSSSSPSSTNSNANSTAPLQTQTQAPAQTQQTNPTTPQRNTSSAPAPAPAYYRPPVSSVS